MEPPREMPPGVEALPEPPIDRPRRSSSTVVCDDTLSSSNDEPVGCEVDAAAGLGSGSKSMSESSFAALRPTPVVVPSVPLGMLFAAVTLPAFMSLYLSIVLCMLSLISRSLCTASASSDSSSHIF